MPLVIAFVLSDVSAPYRIPTRKQAMQLELSDSARTHLSDPGEVGSARGHNAPRYAVANQFKLPGSFLESAEAGRPTVYRIRLKKNRNRSKRKNSAVLARAGMSNFHPFSKVETKHRKSHPGHVTVTDLLTIFSTPSYLLIPNYLTITVQPLHGLFAPSPPCPPASLKLGEHLRRAAPLTFPQ